MKTKKPGFEPRANQVAFDHFTSKALRIFTVNEEYREPLRYIFVNKLEAVATDGKALVRIPHEREDLNAEKAWLIHRDALLLPKKKADVLVLDLLNGELTVEGEGAIYPLRLPYAKRNGDGLTYPEFEQVIATAEETTKVATLGINPELIQRAMVAVGKTGDGIILEIPENSDPYEIDGEPHVQTSVPFRLLHGKTTGLLMPMLVRD
jgi:hypothetical protein